MSGGMGSHESHRLAADWYGRAWLNPPYGQEAWTWLAKLAAYGRGIAAAAIQREIDQCPCPTCGGDPLRPAFDGRNDCHAPWPKEDQTDE